ncbi:MAG: EpsG family protein [Flavobacteriaceae bacterium]|nr:EpsG family protein [Flavobacteriaceae bacterium]
MPKILTVILFTITPIFTFPLTLIEVVKGSKLGYILFALTLAIFTYIFIPFESSDLYKYYNTFEYLKDSSLADLKETLAYRADKGMYYLMKLFDLVGLNMQVLVFFVNLFNISCLLYVFRKLSHKQYLSMKNHLFYFILLLTSVGLIGWYVTASRFFLSITLVFMGYYFLIIKKKKIGLLFFFIAPIFHFSTIMYMLIAVIPSSYFNRKLLRLLFIITLVFHLIPSNALTVLIESNLSLISNENYQRKTAGYTLNEDFNTQGLNNAKNVILQYFFYFTKRIWFFLAIYYLIIKKNNNVPPILFLFFIVLNITAPFPTIFGRFATITSMIFTLHLINESFKYRIRTGFLVNYFIISVFAFTLSVRSIRYQIFDILTSRSSLTTFSIINKKIDTDVIENKWDK